MPMTISGSGTITGITVGGLSNNIINADNIAPGSIGLNLTQYNSKTLLVGFTNSSAYPNVSTSSFTLTAAQAPIGSYVLLGVDVQSGTYAGDQYMYIHQRSNGVGTMGGWVEGWFWYTLKQGLYPINSAEDRSFVITHASITTSLDSRGVYYYGYIKPTP